MPQFPENPIEGQIVAVGPGEDTVLIRRVALCWDDPPQNPGDVYTYSDGEAQAMSRVATSARRFLLRGVICTDPIKKGGNIEVVVEDRAVLTYMFKEDCGWTPLNLGDVSISFRRKGTITQEPVLTLTQGNYTVHNEICVDLPPNSEETSNGTEQAQPSSRDESGDASPDGCGDEDGGNAAPKRKQRKVQSAARR